MQYVSGHRSGQHAKEKGRATFLIGPAIGPARRRPATELGGDAILDRDSDLLGLEPDRAQPSDERRAGREDDPMAGRSGR
ncbi:MAG TPA: hypothetical protein VIJ23_09030 [Mycobacterium sp.]